MVNISEKEFQTKKLASEVFSVISEFRGDEITPIVIFNGLNGKRKFIFESGTKDEHFGRYSFLGENPYREIIGDKKNVLHELKEAVKVPFDRTTNRFNFKGGAIGYMAYDTVALYERKLEFNNNDELNLNSIRFNLYKNYICYDHFTNKVYIVDNILSDDCRGYKEIIEEQEGYFESILTTKGERTFQKSVDCKEIEFTFGTSKESFIENVKKAQEYIVNGDIFQVVLSQRMYCDTEKSSLEIYRKLREGNPSPYMFLIDYENYSLIGSSPERLVTVKGNTVITNPIAGTRKRGKSEEEDNLLARDLLEDEKELAEHVMLVDLGRNDIGKISKVGTVKVNDFMKVEKFSHVMHITTNVQGELMDNMDEFNAIESCLPAGTVSGAPKIRAMEIIEELEEYRRGIYSGAVGYLSYGGDIDTCIAIRTMILKDKVAYLQAGAGIVYDSVPEKEFEEIQNKLMVLKEVLKWLL